MKLSDLPIKSIQLSDMPFYHKSGAMNGNTYVQFKEVKIGGNEPYCYVQEKACQNHICRVLRPKTVYDKCTVIRDDGTVWTVHLSNFQEAYLLQINTEDYL